MLPSLGEPLMERVCVLGKLLAQLIVLLLPLSFLGKLDVPFGDDLLQIAPRLFQRLHVEPGVRVGAHVEALDLLVQVGQRLEIGFGIRQRSLENNNTFGPKPK